MNINIVPKVEVNGIPAKSNSIILDGAYALADAILSGKYIFGINQLDLYLENSHIKTLTPYEKNPLLGYNFNVQYVDASNDSYSFNKLIISFDVQGTEFPISYDLIQAYVNTTYKDSADVLVIFVTINIQSVQPP